MLIIQLHYTDNILWPEGTPQAPDLDRERSVEAFECVATAGLMERFPNADVRLWRSDHEEITINADEPTAPDVMERIRARVEHILARVYMDRDTWEVSMPEIKLPPADVATLRAGHPIDLPLPIWSDEPVYILQTPPDDPDDRYLFVQIGERVMDIPVYPLFSKSGRPIQWGRSADPAIEKSHRLRVADTALAILAHYFRESATPETVNGDQIASIYYVRGLVRDILLTVDGRHNLTLPGLKVGRWLAQHRLNTADLLRRLRSDRPGK